MAWLLAAYMAASNTVASLVTEGAMVSLFCCLSACCAGSCRHAAADEPHFLKESTTPQQFFTAVPRLL